MRISDWSSDVCSSDRPNAAQWAEDKIVPKSIWPKAGEIGMLCPTVPEAYGGLGLDFGYNAIVDEESAYYGRATTGFSLQSDIVTSYIVKYGSEEQKKHWLPRKVRSEEKTSELQSLMPHLYAVFSLQ